MKHVPIILISSTQSTDSSDSTELYTNNSYRDSNNPIIFIPEKALTNSSTSTLSNVNVPKKEYAYVSIVWGKDTGPRSTSDVPKDIHVRQPSPTDPEENKITDPNFQRESPTDEISTELRKQIPDVTISHELISSTKTQVVTPEQALKSKLHDNNLNTSAENSIIYSNFLENDSLTTTAANLEIKKIAKDLEYKFQQQMKSFEDKHNTTHKQTNNTTQHKNYSEEYDTISEETELSDK